MAERSAASFLEVQNPMPQVLPAWVRARKALVQVQARRNAIRVLSSEESDAAHACEEDGVGEPAARSAYPVEQNPDDDEAQ
jgi:hypothetical protein